MLRNDNSFNFSVGQLGGDFPIGYVVTKNATELLLENTLNLDDVDDEYAWADSSMGHWVTITGGSAIEDEIAAIPTGPMMLQNYPNPTKGKTAIGFNLSQADIVNLTIYDVSGQFVKTLIDGQYYQAGESMVYWNGNSQTGEAVPNGVYFYMLDANGEKATKKLILLK